MYQKCEWYVDDKLIKQHCLNTVRVIDGRSNINFDLYIRAQDSMNVLRVGILLEHTIDGATVRYASE